MKLDLEKNKESITFPLRIPNDINLDLDDAINYIKRESATKISKHQFVLEAVIEKIQKTKETV